MPMPPYPVCCYRPGCVRPALYKIAARIGRHTYAGAWGRNKKEAEQRAAMNAFAQINGDPVPFEHD